MQITEIRGEFRKTVSDGNYGNETFSVSFVATVGGDEDAGAAVDDLSSLAAKLVHRRLRFSDNRAIRRALMTPKELQADYDLEQEEYRREAEERTAKRESERQARLAAGEKPSALDEPPL